MSSSYMSLTTTRLVRYLHVHIYKREVDCVRDREGKEEIDRDRDRQTTSRHGHVMNTDMCLLVYVLRAK